MSIGSTYSPHRGNNINAPFHTDTSNSLQIIPQCVMPATFYWKWFSVHNVQIASNDNKKTHFRRKNTSYAKSNYENIIGLPNYVISSVIKNSPQCRMQVEYASKTKCHERVISIFPLCLLFPSCVPGLRLFPVKFPGLWNLLDHCCHVPIPCPNLRTQSLPSSSQGLSWRPPVATGCPSSR